MKRRQPGLLTPSDELLDLIRLCRALGEWPVRKLTSVALGDLVAAEAELGVTLPDDLLVAIASRAPVLRRALGLEKDALLGILDVADADVADFPGDVVAVCRVYSQPFAAHSEGAHGGPWHVLGVKRPGDAASSEILVTEPAAVGRDDGDSDDDPITMSIAGFARAKLTDWFSRESAVWMAALKSAARSPLVDPKFQPMLVGSASANPASTMRAVTVTHAKFGEGQLLESRVENGETKLVIDFASVGRKTLLDRFVTRKE